jgi:hypothetical protein
LLDLSDLLGCLPGCRPFGPVGFQSKSERIPGARPLGEGSIGIAFREPAQSLADRLSRLVVMTFP